MINTYANINPYLNAFDKMQKGYYMNSVIYADKGASCVLCGQSNFVSFSFFHFKPYSVSVCPKCAKTQFEPFPNRIRVRRSLPVGVNSKAERVDIRWTKDSKRIKSIIDAIALARQIDAEIENKTFDPSEYQSSSVMKEFKFKNIIQKVYIKAYQAKYERGEIGSGFNKKKNYINHLNKFFADKDIRKIDQQDVLYYWDTWNEGLRTRDLVIQEMKCMWGFFRERGYQVKNIKFPAIKKSKKRDGENFLSGTEFFLVLNHIKDPLYKSMIETLWHYAMRPCEVRAIQWGDINFQEGYIEIKRHFSDENKLELGRKSNKEHLFLPITERFLSIIKDLKKSGDEDFLFMGKRGGAVGDTVMGRHWRKALKDAGMRKVDLYEGTRHSRASYLDELGYSDEEVMELTGHKTYDALRRYKQKKRKSKLNNVRAMISKNSESGRLLGSTSSCGVASV